MAGSVHSRAGTQRVALPAAEPGALRGGKDFLALKLLELRQKVGKLPAGGRSTVRLITAEKDSRFDCLADLSRR